MCLCLLKLNSFCILHYNICFKTTFAILCKGINIKLLQQQQSLFLMIIFFMLSLCNCSYEFKTNLILFLSFIAFVEYDGDFSHLFVWHLYRKVYNCIICIHEFKYETCEIKANIYKMSALQKNGTNIGC